MSWRLHPERWLESRVLKDIAAIDERIEQTARYSKVPAFSASDRAMIDILSVTPRGSEGVPGLLQTPARSCTWS